LNAVRVSNAAFYQSSLCGLDGVELPGIAGDRTHVFHQYTLRVRDADGLNRDSLAMELGARGIGVGVYYPLPLHRQRSLGALGLGGGVFPFADRAAAEVLSIPVHPGITPGDREYVAESILEVVARSRATARVG
jgi:dTDP-4-amino-4,6-dideoxygalactose transaminase